MRWTIEEIRTFLDVMDTGTVSGAAARSNLSKSVVSKRIADLEAALGAALFQRHAGRISPTASAEELALRLRPALAEMNDAVESAAWGMAGLRGSLAIAAPMSFGTSHLSSVVADFARQHPDLDITLDYDDRVMDLVRGRFDVAVRIGQLRDSGLIVRKLCEDPRVIVASADYVRRRGAPESLDDLQAHSSIGYLNVQATSVWQFRGDDGAVSGVPMKSRVSANNGEAMRDMAIAGLGIALLPLFVAHEALRKGQLIRVAEKLKPTPLPISVVWPPVKPMPMKLRAIVDHLAKAFAEQPPWLS
ncbi:LysR family transcriptional regulator [Mesorhizobium sp. YM1C-6-2]|uniref:LysR family transcriptional regulator n=1 Tax=Mesorhizobium sp. YM1C-6-2 TaxID=1827501 RepID=UPI000EF1C3E5|nr:LysR family transcriptional regulator [Mesorhizobium sp. YM1C-6-2]RLP28463.1 LysR family transcriptional regulator [Mesorhizobium sp. YM1C-6-2]